MDNDDFVRLLKHYASTEPEYTKNKPDFVLKDADGTSTVVDVKTSRTNPIFFINSKVYGLLGRTIFKTTAGVLSFDENSSTMGFLEEGTSTVRIMKLQKRRIQWFLCREVFDRSPNVCTDGDLEIGLRNDTLLNVKDYPREEKVHKFFTNASDRINTRAIRQFGIKMAIDHSDTDFFIYRSYLPK